MKRALAASSLLIACGSQPPTAGVSQERLMDPTTCAECHQTQYDEWAGSMHAYASDDPLFVALNHRAQGEAHVGNLCVSCHAPVAARTQATTDGLNLAELPASLHGVTCYACHSVDQVTGSHNDALHAEGDGELRGEYEDPFPNSVHGSVYSVIHDRTQLQSSGLCGSCHDVVNGHGVAIERSFAEWQASAFSTVNGSTCGECHMAKADQRAPAADVPGAPIRDLHSHKFPGVDLALNNFPYASDQRAAVQSFLDTTLQTALCVRGKGQNASIVVIVDNVAAGHAFPSGAAQDRRAWFEVSAFAGDKQLLRSGQVPSGTDPTALNDPDRWLVRDCMLDANGQPVSGLWNAASVDSNLLPAQVTFDKTSPQYYQTHVFRSFPKDPLLSLSAFPDRVTLDVHVLPFPLDLFDDLFGDPKSLGLDAAAVANMRAELTPLSIGPQLVWTADAVADTAHGGLTFVDDGMTMACVSSTGLNAAADRVPAPEHESTACGL